MLKSIFRLLSKFVSEVHHNRNVVHLSIRLSKKDTTLVLLLPGANKVKFLDRKNSGFSGIRKQFATLIMFLKNLV